MERGQPPHSFQLFGKTWRVLFLDPIKIPSTLTRAEKGFIRRRDLQLKGLTVVTRSTQRRAIYIHPASRKDWQVFGHEILHALIGEMTVMRHEKGWSDRMFRHFHLDMLAIPLGEFLRENLSASARPPRRPRSRRTGKSKPGRRKGSS